MQINQVEEKKHQEQHNVKPMPGGNGHLPGSIKVDQITIIGSHNAACSKAYGWLYAQQNVTIKDQFEKYGSRYFKIPIHWFVESNNLIRQIITFKKSSSKPIIVCAHEANGQANCKLTIFQKGLQKPDPALNRFKELGELAHKHPNELMIVFIEQYLYGKEQHTLFIQLISKQGSSNGSHHFTKEEVCQQLEKLLTDAGLKQRALVWSKYKCPNLDFVRKNKKNVIIFIDSDSLATESQLANFCLYGFRQLAQFDWERDPLDNKNLPSDIKRGYHFNNPYRIASNFLLVHFNPESSLHREKTYRSVYNEYNHVKRRYEAISNHYKKKINIISTDFVDQGDLIKFVEDCNKELLQMK